ncbi:7306_t:CDS:2 [Gigaspora margarita]|uniref:7306_t:CDS:1 n=1 Tax=Gigaspora margarita TaxID=4874 RepID=A0ABN7VTB5_GIGMA|nr:7306_t:CDS:2 [Gigaspora margarita]
MSRRPRGSRANENFVNLQRDIRLPGTPRPIKPVEDNIDRTPEYKAFMKSLEEFHRAHGTPLQKEPVLGSKKLDLYKIYNMVISHGGCEKICLEKSWKKICEPFNFPSTCTNSAYVMKNVYIRFLEAYEMEKHWGKTVPYGGLPPKPPISPQISQSHDHQYTTSHQELSTPPLQRRILAQENLPGFLLGGGHHNRILLALKSNLPNEVDWAFEILVQLSADEIINFYVDKIPGLVDTILLFVSPFYKDLRKLTGHDSVCTSAMDYCKDVDNIEATINEFLSSSTKVEQLKRIMQIFLMFRNLSFTEHNVKFMAGYKPLRRFLIESLVLPEVARLSELKHHCLETVTNMCRVITLRSSKDELLSTLPKLLYSKDSALVLLSIRAMASLAANEHNADFLREIDPTTVQRLVQLLLIEDDEELILAVLDWFYQYSTYEDSAYTIAQNAPGNFVRLLINFLRYGANEEDFMYDQRTSMESQSFQIHGEFEDYPEPYRTLEWLKRYYEESQFDGVLQTEIWYAYRDQFMNSPMPMMPAAEVIKHVNQACRWTGCMSLPFAAENDLYNHVFSDHINSEQERFECHWMGCRRFPCGVESRTSVIAHVKTHFPVLPDLDGDNRKHRGKSARFKVLNKYGKNNGIINHRTHVSVDVNGDAIGIPLTASLILRNLSISRKNLQYFEAYEQELTELLANCVGLSKHLAETLSNLKSV